MPTIFALILLLSCPVMLYSRALHESSGTQATPPNLVIPEPERSEGNVPVPSVDQHSQSYRGKRAATSTDSYLWKEGIIPYEFSPAVLRDRRVSQAIREAMTHWEQNTCIRFVPYKNGTFKDYLYFTTSPGSGCSADVGRIGNGSQEVEIGSRCAPLVGVTMHELGHSIGFWHEHTRPDRDCYIEILKENIDTRFKSNFIKRQPKEIDSLGVPYDLDSIMHYSLTAFSKNNEPTIRVKGNYSGRVGQRYFLSDKDIQQANLLYNCEAMTKRTPPSFNGEIQNGNTIALRIEDGSRGLGHNWLRCKRDLYCSPTGTTCAGYHFDSSDWKQCKKDTFRIFSVDAHEPDEPILVGDTVILESGASSGYWLSCVDGHRCKLTRCGDAISSQAEACSGIHFTVEALGYSTRDVLKDQHIIGLRSTNDSQWMACKKGRLSHCRKAVCSTAASSGVEPSDWTNCSDSQFTITKRGNSSRSQFTPTPSKGRLRPPVDCSVSRE